VDLCGETQKVRPLAHVREFRPNRLQVFPQRLGTVCSEEPDNPSFELRYERLGNGNDLLSTVCGENEFGATVPGVGNACQTPCVSRCCTSSAIACLVI
jgi:hypothetical protein